MTHALVLADGSVGDRAALDAAWPGWDDDIELVVAADGGARHAAGLGLPVDAWIGDGDSVDDATLAVLEAGGTRMERVPAAKDASDTELALIAALEAGATRVTILGALGGARFDHALANVELLALAAARDVDLRIVDAGARIRLLAGPGQLDLAGRAGDLVTLLPLGDVSGVTTHGLRYPLRDEPLPVGPARGLSNLRDEAAASVAIRGGRLLVVEVPATLAA